MSELNWNSDFEEFLKILVQLQVEGAFKKN